MTEQHRHQLRPAAKTTRVMLRAMLAHRLGKFGPRKYPQNLRKNTAYSTHGGKLLGEIGFPGRNPNLNLAAFPPSPEKPNLDKSDSELILRSAFKSALRL
jgi:hypothetical protein